MPRAQMTAWTVALRTRIIDDYLCEAVSQCVDVVLDLGAGLDARPYRLDLPANLRWIEADKPAVLALKEQRLAGAPARCLVERHAVDLADAAARHDFLARATASARRPLALTEGLVPYLDEAQAAALARDLREAGIALWIIDRLAPLIVAERRRAGLDQRMTRSPVRFAPPDWAGFFASNGWHVREMRWYGAESRRLRRPMPLPARQRLALWLARHLTKAGKAELAGYALLAPAPGPKR
jgi:methyltransferase (TIGR00027 family)